MSNLLNNLKEAIDSKDENEIAEVLKEVVSQGANIELPNNSLVKQLILLKNSKIIESFVEVAAEWTKSEHNRQLFTDKEVVDYLLELLECSEETLLIGAIRALGNICYENESGRKLIDKKGLILVLKILELDDSRKNNLLTLKVSGFLVNLLMGNDDLQKAALNLKILDAIEKLLCKYWKSFKENQMLFAFLLTVLNNVMDFIDELHIPFTEGLCSIIINIFKTSTVPEISVLCLEILHGQSEKDDIKIILARQGICEHVFQLIEKYRVEVIDEESRSVMKMACDLIVVILTGDECMFLLYNNGQGTVYKNMVTWLDADDPDLLSTGVLALGNFARKDTHCIQMVKNGISKQLINLIVKYTASESDVKVQHALLSTLKNLVIPQENKTIVLQEGLIGAIYPLIKSDQSLVVFKLLGTFRMAIDGQEKTALDLISRPDFLNRLMHWYQNSDHLGVRGEIPRLLAWLIKHCHSFRPYKSLLKTQDCIKCLVEMITSNHAVMQNESLYALNLLCIGCAVDCDSTNGVGDHDDNDDLYRQLCQAEIGKNLEFIVSKYGDKMEKQTVENILAFLEQLQLSEIVVIHLKENKVAEALDKLKSNTNVPLEKLNRIMVKIC